MKAMTLSVLFDRKKVADNKKNKGLIQICVCFDRKRWYFSTGIKCFKNQWNNSSCRVVNIDAQGVLTQQYNERIDTFVSKITGYDNERIANDWEFDIDALKRRLEGGVSGNFLEWAYERMREKKGILRPETLRSHKSNIKMVEEFGKIVHFSDITLENIIRFNEWMVTDKHYSSQTIWTKHKVLKTYVAEAMRMDKIKANPYERFSVGRKMSLGNTIISDKDIKKIRKAKLPDGYHKTRDILLLIYNTGLAYTDLYAADFSNVVTHNGIDVLIGKRQKTGIAYFVPIFQEVKDILAKYNGTVPPITNQQLNVRCKKVCELAGLENWKSVTSHAFRKGAGSNLLRKGVRMETVSKFLGHSSIRLTEKVYAKLDVEAVAEEISDKIIKH